jgi:hypothetical protein
MNRWMSRWMDRGVRRKVRGGVRGDMRRRVGGVGGEVSRCVEIWVEMEGGVSGEGEGRCVGGRDWIGIGK